MPKKKKKVKKSEAKKMLRLLLVVAGLVGLLILIRIPTFVNKSQNKLEDTASNVAVLEGLAQTLEIKPELRDSIYWDWISGNMRLPLTGKEFLMGTVNINGIGQYNKFAEDDLNNITFASLEPIVASTNSYFLSQGFIESAQNQRKTNLGVSDSEYFGFENGDMKCLYRLSATTDPFGYFFCGTVDEGQLNLQHDFLPMFEEQFRKDPFAGFRVDKVEGNFATGAFYESVGGYQWIAEKTGTNWKVIWTGQELPMCEEMTKLEIPKSIYGNCYKDSMDPREN